MTDFVGYGTSQNCGDLFVTLDEKHRIFVVDTSESRKEGNTEESVLKPASGLAGKKPEYHVDRFARQIDALQADSSLGFVVCAQQNFLSEAMERPPSWCDPRTLAGPQHGFGANTLLLRRAVFVRVGPFDPDKVPLDDSDWLVRALDGGERYLHLDAVLVRHRIHDANLSARRMLPRFTHLMARTLHESLKRRRDRDETR